MERKEDGPGTKIIRKLLGKKLRCVISDGRVFFGTLLGFIRDGNFMTHDEDTDIALINPTNDFLSDLKTACFVAILL